MLNLPVWIDFITFTGFWIWTEFFGKFDLDFVIYLRDTMTLLSKILIVFMVLLMILPRSQGKWNLCLKRFFYRVSRKKDHFFLPLGIFCSGPPGPPGILVNDTVFENSLQKYSYPQDPRKEFYDIPHIFRPILKFIAVYDKRVRYVHSAWYKVIFIGMIYGCIENVSAIFTFFFKQRRGSR